MQNFTAFCFNGLNKVIALMSVFIIISCGINSDAHMDYSVKYEVSNDFDAFFSVGEEFIIQDTTFLNRVSNLIQIEFTRDSLVIIPSSIAKIVFIFNTSGELISKIDKNGKGPGEFEILGRVSVDDSDNIYVYDPSQRKLIQYLAPEYSSFNEFYSSFNLAKFVVLDSIENIITYSPYNSQLFTKFDLSSDEIKKTYLTGDDPKFKIWLGRIQTGGVVVDRLNRVIYGVYPEKLEIFRFSDNLELMDTFEAPDSESFVQEFPGNLNPYDYSQQHIDWWNSTNQIGRIFLVDVGLVAVTHDKSNKENPKENHEYVNIFDFESQTILLRDVNVPEGGSIVGFNNRKVWIVYPPKLDENGNEIPLRIMTHTLIS